MYQYRKDIILLSSLDKKEKTMSRAVIPDFVNLRKKKKIQTFLNIQLLWGYKREPSEKRFFHSSISEKYAIT